MNKLKIMKSRLKSVFSAIQKGDLQAVKKELNCIADLNAENDCGWTPFLWAVRHKRVALAQYLLDQGAKIDVHTNKNEINFEFLGANALMIAINLNDGAMRDMLLSRGIDIGFTDFAGLNALVYAAVKGDEMTGKKLIDLGLRFPDSECEYALRGPVKRGQLNFLELLIDTHPDAKKLSQLLVLAAEWGHLSIVQYFVSLGMDLNVVDPNTKGTALIEAASCGRVEIVEFLLKNGADRLRVLRKGHDALFWAKEHKHKEVINILKKS